MKRHKAHVYLLPLDILSMDRGQVLKGIQANIEAGRKDMAVSQIMELTTSSSDDPFTLLTCVSLLKVIGDNDDASKVVRTIVRNTRTDNVEIAKGLRNLGYPHEAVSIIEDVNGSDEALRIKMDSLFDMGKMEDALLVSSKMVDRTIDDDVRRAEILSALGDHKNALALITGLSSESSEFTVFRCLISVLVSAGDRKGAERFVKNEVKKDKESADANALAAYHMWIEGKTSPAAAYATKAIKADNRHVGAMEVFAYCLIEKDKASEARTVAGAINEVAPGHPSIMKILDMCL